MPSASARRYARAVFELASETGSIEAWGDSLGTLRSLLEDERARGILSNPTLAPDRRVAAMEALAPADLGSEILNLGKLLVSAGRVSAIGDVVTEYEALADAAAGRVRAVATTAVELEKADRERLAADLSRRLGKEVRLEVRVDPGIIGGLVLQFGDRLVDASIRTRLQQLRRRLATA